jgi:hypothetical protein
METPNAIFHDNFVSGSRVLTRGQTDSVTKGPEMKMYTKYAKYEVRSNKQKANTEIKA